MTLVRLIDRALGLLFARPCQACGARVAEPTLGTACAACWARLQAEPQPDVKLLFLESPAFDRARAAFSYGGLLRELVQAFKFRDHPSLRRNLGASLAQRCEDVAAWDCQAVVVVPPSPSSKGRGYEPAALLAAPVAQSLHLPVWPVLSWARSRGQQSHLGLQDRFSNAAGALRAQGSRLQGARVLLVDDLISSGATAHDAARALRAAGASFVGVLALAHALPD